MLFQLLAEYTIYASEQTDFGTVIQLNNNYELIFGKTQ